MNEVLNIIYYALVWSVLAITYFYRNRRISISFLLLLDYALTSLTSIYFYFNAPLSRYIDNVTFLPFVYLFVCIFICIYPILKEEKVLSSIKVRYYNDHNLIPIFLLLVSPFILVTVYELFLASYKMDAVSISEAYGNLDYSVSMVLSSTARKGYILCHFLAYVWPFAIFYCLSKKGIYRYCSIIALLAYIVEILQGYLSGDRVTLLRFFLYISIVFYLFKNNMVKKIYRKIMFFGFSSFFVIILLMLYISYAWIDNMGTDLEMNSFLALYSGEGCIRFSQYIWGLDKVSFGDTSFSLIKWISGLDTFTNNADRRAFYENFFQIPTYIFFTFIGDWVQDLGKVLTLIFCILINRIEFGILARIKKYGNALLIDIFFLSILLQIFFFGFMYYNFKTFNDQLQLIPPFIMILFIELWSYKNKKKVL